MAPRTHYARNGDVHIAYQAFGEGPVDVVFVPPAFHVTEHLQELPAAARFFERMAERVRLIVYDRRGSGMSDRPTAAPTLEEQVDDVTAVMEAVGSQRAALLALFEGGQMALLFAAQRPERVGALVLHDCFARTSWAPDYDWAMTIDERAAHPLHTGEHWGDGQLMLPFAPSHADDPRFLEWGGKLQRLALPPGSVKQFIAQSAEVDVRAILPTIHQPVLVMRRREETLFDRRHAVYLSEQLPNARLVEVPGIDALPFFGDTDAWLGEVMDFLGAARPVRETDRVLATVLFTDIVDSTGRAAALGDERWRDLLAEHERIIQRHLQRHAGVPVKSIGDGYLATFDGPARAVRAARGIVNDAGDAGLAVRAGLHTGEVERIGDDVGGLAVHIAARVMAAAEGPEVITSGTVKDLVVGSELRFEPRGVRELRGVPGEWALYRVAA